VSSNCVDDMAVDQDPDHASCSDRESWELEAQELVPFSRRRLGWNDHVVTWFGEAVRLLRKRCEEDPNDNEAAKKYYVYKRVIEIVEGRHCVPSDIRGFG
jgi:hypothetical protein